MLDAVLRRRSEALLAPVAERLAAWRIGAWSLTAAAFVASLVAVLDIGRRAYLLGLAMLVLARVFDALDGPVARREGRMVPLLDLVLGLLAEAAIPFAFALAAPERALAAMFLMLGLVARAAVTVAQVRAVGTLGQVLEQAGRLIGKSELFLAYMLACLFPNWFSIIAYVVGILCFVSAGSWVAAALGGEAA